MPKQALMKETSMSHLASRHAPRLVSLEDAASESSYSSSSNGDGVTKKRKMSDHSVMRVKEEIKQETEEDEIEEEEEMEVIELNSSVVEDSSYQDEAAFSVAPLSGVQKIKFRDFASVAIMEEQAAATKSKKAKVSAPAAGQPDLESALVDILGTKALCHSTNGRFYVEKRPLFKLLAVNDASSSSDSAHIPAPTTFRAMEAVLKTAKIGADDLFLYEGRR
jgi:hypothetical protein